MTSKKPFISSGFNYETMEETLDVKPKASSLSIGIPRETAFQENRIALSPDAVGVLVSNGHHVSVEHKAGERAHFSDGNYVAAGAQIVHDKKELFKHDMIVKSAPVSDEELPLLTAGQTIISPIHLPVMKTHILEKMMEKRITALSFENLKDESGHNPIVRSMSEIAGSAVMLIAGQYLSSANSGKGMLLGGISGIPPTKVVIIGAGIVGEYAARTALAVGASVKVFDNNIYKLKRLQNNIGVRLWTSVLEPKILSKQLKTCDVAVGALSSSSGRTPVVVTEEPKFAELKENSNGTFTYIPNEKGPETPTLDQVTFEYTALSGATVVVRKQFILVEKGDVPSLIQTGYGPVSGNFGHLFLLIFPIALAMFFSRKGRKNA